MACETPFHPPASPPREIYLTYPQNLNLNQAEAEVGIAPKSETRLVFPAHILIFAVAICIFASGIFFSAALDIE